MELNDESRQWLARLDPEGLGPPGAIHALFERTTGPPGIQEARRRRGSLPARILDELDDIARQAADDALGGLRDSDDYRGASRFHDVGLKFAIFEVSAALRREASAGRWITIEDDTSWDRIADLNPIDPHAQTEIRELVAVVERTVAADLTPRQRDVFVAIIVRGIPIDVVADRHGSSRGAVYKVLYDARQKLRLALVAQGWDVGAAGEAT